MRIRITRDVLPPSPIPVQSCFFCGMPVVSETARAISDVDDQRCLGWSCLTCLRCTPDQRQQMLGAKISHLRSCADRHYGQAEALSVQADELERIMHVLDRPLLPGESTGRLANAVL